MSFESNAPKHIQQLQDTRITLYHEISALRHSCSCEYCEYDGIDEENQKEYDKLQDKIADVNATIKAIRAHMKLFKEELAKDLV